MESELAPKTGSVLRELQISTRKLRLANERCGKKWSHGCIYLHVYTCCLLLACFGELNYLASRGGSSTVSGARESSRRLEYIKTTVLGPTLNPSVEEGRNRNTGASVDMFDGSAMNIRQ
jgi:hypothetical protein